MLVAFKPVVNKRRNSSKVAENDDEHFVSPPTLLILHLWEGVAVGMPCWRILLCALAALSRRCSFAWRLRPTREVYREKVLRWVQTSTLLTLGTLTSAGRAFAEDLPPEIRQRVDFVEKVQRERELFSDEFEIQFNETSLGLSIRENIYNGFPVLTVEDSRISYPLLRKGAIITRVGGRGVDGLAMAPVIQAIQEAPRPVTLRFRDPTRFFELLDSVTSRPFQVITTSYLPANAR